MTDLRQAAQQVLDAWQTSLYGKPSHQKAVVLAMTNLNIVLQQQAEPVSYEQDANRYRWLRDKSNMEQAHQIWQHVINGRGPSVDAFVDAAIKFKEPK